MADHQYDQVLCQTLLRYASLHDWKGMDDYVHTLSHSRFRTVCCLLSNQVLPSLSSDDYWGCFFQMVPSDCKAFLVTFLKPAVELYAKGSLSVMDDRLRRFASLVAAEGRLIDERKALSALLPIVKTPGEVRHLLDIFQLVDVGRVVPYLIQADTLPCHFVLFQVFRKIDSEKSVLVEYCNRLLQNKTDRSFNMVSIAKCYFDLPDVRGRFSLHLEAYQLSRLELSYEVFCKIMSSI